jgi:hypothetical protein
LGLRRGQPGASPRSAFVFLFLACQSEGLPGVRDTIPNCAGSRIRLRRRMHARAENVRRQILDEHGVAEWAADLIRDAGCGLKPRRHRRFQRPTLGPISNPGSPALSMKAALLRLPATANPLENEERRDGWRPGIIESVRLRSFALGAFIDPPLSSGSKRL